MEQATEMDLRYPIGHWQSVDRPTTEERAAFIEAIAALPGELRAAVDGLDDTRLDTPYRPEGWTVRQVVHHVPDSHLNSYIRFKWGLTEDAPTIKTYEEGLWAELPDSRGAIGVSLDLLEALHARWVGLLRALTEADYSREITHPEHGRMTLGRLLSLYAWHSKHHLAHVTSLRARSGW